MTAAAARRVTEVPDIVRTTPVDGETLYGPFVALAQAGLPGADGAVELDRRPVSLTITRPARGTCLPRPRTSTRRRGAGVSALPPGAYARAGY